MIVDDEKLNRIYDKTCGKCHLCHKKLSFTNYGRSGAKGAWEIEHSKPKSMGGTDHLNNLYAACIRCNRQKSNSTNYSVRSKNGVRKAPLSAKARKRKMLTNTAKGIVAGATIGRFLGPGGAFICGAIGGLIASEEDSDQ